MSSFLIVQHNVAGGQEDKKTEKTERQEDRKTVRKLDRRTDRKIGTLK
jgi:hypothetical protein